MERKGQRTQLSRTEETTASANLQRTITQTAASAGGTLLTHGKLSRYYLCCLDLPLGFPRSSFIFPQCSFSPTLLLSALSTNCQRMNTFWENVLVIFWIVKCIIDWVHLVITYSMWVDICIKHLCKSGYSKGLKLNYSCVCEFNCKQQLYLQLCAIIEPRIKSVPHTPIVLRQHE